MNYQTIIDKINESINILLNQYRLLFSKEEIIDIKRKQFNMRKLTFNTYEEIKKYENLFLPYFARVWRKEISNLDDFKIGDNFKILITCPTSSVDNISFKKRDFISASLITDKHFGTFNAIKFGIACSVSEENLLAISSDDAHGVIVNSSDSQIDKYFYTNETSTGRKIYNKKYVFSLRLPNQVETDLIKENILENGEFISQKYKSVYSDISLDAKNTKFLKVILFTPCSQKDQEEANKLASKFGLDVLPISTKFYYDKIAVSNLKNDKHVYDILDLDTILFIGKRGSELEKEYSNLIFSRMNEQAVIKDEDNIAKIVVDITNDTLILIINDDTRFFKIDYSSKETIYSIDNQIVSDIEFAQVLEEIKQKRSPKLS